MEPVKAAATVDAASTKTAIELKSVAVDFVQEGRKKRVLDGINIAIAEESFISLIGPSGCGKSTLLRVISDLVPEAEGTVTVFGRSAAEARRNREIGFVFQDSTLLPWRTVIENVLLPLEVKAGGGRADAAAAGELLALVGLEGRHNAYPHELSGGMRQRVAIARSLICRPRLLLMDEPFGALDEITRDKMNEELLRIWRETRTTIVFVTHSIAEAAYLGDRVIVLQANPGRVRKDIDIEFGRGRTPPVRDTAAFVEHSAELRALLGEAH